MGYESLVIENDDKVLIFERKQINKGYYSDGVIAIKESLNESEKNCVLAEELGHFHTSHGDILDQSKIINIKKEAIARRWAYRKLLPLEVFIEAFEKRRLDRYEMVDDLQITEEFLDACIDYYRKKYGAAVSYGKYTIMFEPNLQMIKWL